MPWKMDRRRRSGVRSSPFDAPRNAARSRAVHSHSRFCRNPNCEGNVSEFNVVSIWKIFTPLSRSTLPIRQFDECSSERCWSMNDFECVMVFTLWWCFSDL
jgi:hypothetical protein